MLSLFIIRSRPGSAVYLGPIFLEGLPRVAVHLGLFQLLLSSGKTCESHQPSVDLAQLANRESAKSAFGLGSWTKKESAQLPVGSNIRD